MFNRFVGMSDIILIIEDDPSIAQLLTYNFQKEQFDVKHTVSGEDGLSLLTQKIPSLIILDLMLPGICGLDACRIIKSEPKTKNIPIIMLTAKSEEMDKIIGLGTGADDYVTKPFSVRELILRVKAILKRSTKSTPQKAVLVFKDLTLDSNEYRVTLGKQKIDLTLTEFKLLLFLLSNPNKIFSRDRLLNQVWGYQYDVFSRTVDTHITRLRSKLGSHGQYLVSVRSVGYRWEGAT